MGAIVAHVVTGKPYVAVSAGVERVIRDAASYPPHVVVRRDTLPVGLDALRCASHDPVRKGNLELIHEFASHFDGGVPAI